MHARARLHSLAPHLLPVCVVLITLTARGLPGARTIDDAYITFRYARNILAGLGFVYNPGEHVLGTTTPLYTILVAILGAISGGVHAPFPQIALILNALADSLTSLLLLNLGRRMGSSHAGTAAALVWAIAPFSVTFAIGGLETSLYVLLLTAVVWAYLQKQYTLTALLAALSLLTRPDALILLGPLALDWMIQTIRRNPTPDPSPSRRAALERGDALQFLHSLAAIVLPLLPWIIFASIYFGSPIPHSIAAKSLAYRLAPSEGLVRLLQHYATPFMEDVTFGKAGIMVGLVIYPFLALIGVRRALRANPRCWPFAIYPWFYFIVFALANPLIFRWYLTPPLPAYFLTILIGMDNLLTSLLTRRRLTPQTIPLFPRMVLTLCVILIPLGLTLREWTLHPDHGPDRPAPTMAWYQLELLYRQVARILAPDLRPDTVLAAGDVGVLGYDTSATILDAVGLNSPQATRYYPLDPTMYAINYAIAPELILDQRPDYLVILEVYGRKGLLEDARFWQSYQLLHKIPTDIYSSDGMLVFEKKPPSPP